MPLSEREQKVLDQLEAQLSADPHFAKKWDAPGATAPRRGISVPRLVLGILLALVGLGGVLAGVAVHLVPLGVAGFVLMGTGVLVALAAGGSGDRSGRSTGRGPSPLMQKLEQRWDERRGRPGGL